MGIKLIAALFLVGVINLIGCSYRDRYREDRAVVETLSIDLALMHSYVVTQIKDDPRLSPQEKAEKLALWIEMRKRVYMAQTGANVIVYHDEQFYVVNPDGSETEVRWLLWITHLSSHAVE